jgi:hypothetical protein
MDTKALIASMLTENVGRALCDSGGTPQYKDGKYAGSSCGYGRNFERNQGRKFEDEPSSVVRFRVLGGHLSIELEHNVYHWLAERCEVDAKLDKIFHGPYHKEVDKDNDRHWIELMEEFPAWVSTRVVPGTYSTAKKQRKGTEYAEAGGIYGEDGPLLVNTYNEDNLLSQTLQFVYFTWNRDEYVVLQVHGGCDVRGGYTAPHVFSCGSRCETDILEYAQGSVYCTGQDHLPEALAIKEQQEAQLGLPGVQPPTIDFENCDASWYTDDGCHLYDHGACGADCTNLEDLPVVDLDAEPEEGEPAPGWKPGVLCVKDGKGYCPSCGARLAASS